MNEPEANPQNIAGSVDADEAHENLRRQINLLFAALIVSSFTLTAYLGLQAHRASIDYSVTKPQVDAAIQMFQQGNASLQVDLTKLVEFGRTHPDFQKQVLAKYKINGATLPATPAAPAAPK